MPRIAVEEDGAGNGFDGAENAPIHDAELPRTKQELGDRDHFAITGIMMQRVEPNRSECHTLHALVP